MILSLDVLRARKGDCLIMHYGSKNDPGLALIDGGPAQVYSKYLKPRLTKIRNARSLDEEKSLSVDLLMISHIDDDHINGILELSKELIIAKDSMQPSPLKVRSFWHNTFDDIIGNNSDELLSAFTSSFGPAAISGEIYTEGLDPDVAMVLSSVSQGFRLRDDAKKLKLRINPEFGGKLIKATDAKKSIDFGKGLKLTVVGPMQAELVALQKVHDAFLRKHKNDKTTKAALASFSDASVANLSSLVVLAEAGKKRMLLTGDARGDKILKGLEHLSLLKKGSKMHVDVLKIPHHGSDRNIDPVFFRRITADHYVFSGNGENGNPERETLQMLLNESENEEFTIHLTYPIKEIDIEREKDWMKEQQKEKIRKKKDPKVKVRVDWSSQEHSLTSLFEAHKDFARKVSVVEEEEPHVINLLDELGF